MLPPFEEIYEKIVRTESLDDLEKSLIDIRDIYDLAHIVYHALHLPKTSAPNPILLLTYDPQWVERYVAQDYFQIDPVVQDGRSRFLPLDWNDVDRETATARMFFREANKFGVGRNGMTIPIRGPGGERALLSVTSNAAPNAWESSHLSYLKEFLSIAHFIHDQAVRLAGLRESNLKRQLSARERQTLQLAARGFAPKQIAADLHLSSTAVRLYLQGARTKLECSTLSQGIARALSLDIIEA